MYVGAYWNASRITPLDCAPTPNSCISLQYRCYSFVVTLPKEGTEL